MSERFLIVKNFEKYQHYSDRNPPWIKLYYGLLDDMAFLALAETTQMHLVKIWLAVSRHDGFRIPYDEPYIRAAIRAKSKVDLRALIASGFLIVTDASAGASTEPSKPPGENEANASTGASTNGGPPGQNASAGARKAPFRAPARARLRATEVSEVSENLEDLGDKAPNTLTTPLAEASSKQDLEPTVLLAAAANRGIRKRFGEQPSPIRHDAGASHEAVESIAKAGVPFDFARDAIYTCASTSSLPKPPSTLKYFVPVVLERWHAKQAYIAADSSDAKELAPVASTKRTIPSANATELRAAEEKEQERRDAAEFRRRQRLAVRWTKDHPEEYEQLRAEVERGYAGLPVNDITRKAIEVELVSKCADRADQNSDRISEAAI